MAYVFANLAFDMSSIILNDLAAEEISVEFMNNVNETLGEYVYEDVIDIVHGDPLDPTLTIFGGSGIQFNPQGDPIAGTITGVYNEVDSTPETGTITWYAEGFSLDILTLVAAIDSAGTTDDLAVLASIFAGADNFELSRFADRAEGFGGNDRLFGNGGNDTLSGGAGNDTLIGGAGSDQLVGGAGSDNYVVDAAGDVVVEGAVTGTDIVNTSVDYTLGANVENLTLTGTAITGTGNTLANRITGNGSANRLNGSGGNDTLNGGTGNDTMVGGAGNDTYFVNVAGDRTTEAQGAGTGVDTVRASLGWTLGANIENLVLAGSAAIDGTGNGLANRLTGNGGANRLDGGAGNDSLRGAGGNDTLAGGAGNDTLTGEQGSDVFLFSTALNASTNVDTVSDFNRLADQIHLDDAVFAALGAPGALAAGALHLGTAAAAADDRIVYDRDTGSLFYDADGNGAGAQVLFAQLTAGTNLGAENFFVV